jgi:hypothetical protein
MPAAAFGNMDLLEFNTDGGGQSHHTRRAHGHGNGNGMAPGHGHQQQQQKNSAGNEEEEQGWEERAKRLKCELLEVVPGILGWQPTEPLLIF